MGYLDNAGLQYLWGKLKEKFAPKSHRHDDRYYTESEMDGKLNSKVNNNEAGANGLLSNLSVWTATPTDDTYFMRQDTGGGNSFGRVKFSTIWNYIKGKADGVYQPKGSYSASEHTHTKDQVGLGNVDNTADLAKNVNSANYINDVGDHRTLSFAYSKSGLDYGSYLWLAGWNGEELRAVNKNQFATAKHTHDISTLTGNIINTEPSTNNHKIVLGKSGLDKCEFYEYGGVWNFYKMNSGTPALVASIQPDGVHATLKGTADVANFAKETYINQYKTVNLTDLDQNTWYPVTGTSVQGNGLRHFKCSVQLNSGSKPSWSTHSAGFTAVVDILEESSGWGTTGMLGEVLINDQRFIADESKPPVGYQQMNFSSTPVWWLRGGGTYFLATDYDCAWTIKKSKYENDGQSVAPTTTYPGVNVNRATITANLNGNASTAKVATVGVRDYNNANNTIKIGWSGADLDANTLSYVAGYTSDMKIHTASKDGVRSWLGLGNAAYKKIQSLSAVGHSDWQNQSTDDGYVPTMAFMAFWNGAFSGSGASNLQYCDRGRFGTIVTKNSGDYAVAGHTHSFASITGKPSTYTPSAHNQSWSTITDKPALMESGDYSAETIEALLKKVQGLSPRMGSANLTKDTHIANTLWNFIYIPHRTGSGGDNPNYGTLLLFPMTGAGSSYIVRAGKDGIVNEIRKIYTSGDKPNKGDVGLGNVDNTADANKSVKYATSAGRADYATNAGSANGVTPEWSGSVDLNSSSWLAAWSSDGKKIKAMSAGTFAPASHSHAYLSLNGGTMSGQITKSTGGSWIGDRDRAAIKSSYAGDSAYGAVAAMATKNGYWTIGNLGGNESLIFNYSTDANYNAGNNSTAQVYLPAQAGTIITSATIGGQSVNYANSSRSATNATNATTATKLSSNAGSSVQPVYFSDGKPVVIGYTIAKSVPADAKFTDTTYGVATSTSNGLMSSDDKTKLDSFSKVISIQKQIKLTTDWQDTGVAGNSLDTGTYVVQVSGFNPDSTFLWGEMYSGIMTWYSGSTNNDNASEIFLHNAGHADNHNAIYLRTLRTTGGGSLKLQIACKIVASDTDADTLTFKFRRLI